MTSLTAIRGDITQVDVEAIVNAANSTLMGGGGVDGAIHRAGGPSILDECRAIVARQGGCEPGAAVITSAGELPARFVIHTVGPVWDDDQAEELDEVLASCYRESLSLAANHGVRTIAFPNISTGLYRYPKARAAQVAVDAVRSWLEHHDHTIETVTFVCFDQDNLSSYEPLLSP